VVPSDHLLRFRSIDRFVKFGELRWEIAEFLQRHWPALGRSRAYDPLIVGYCFGIRSARIGGSAAWGWMGMCRSFDLSKNRHGRFRDLLQLPDQVSELAVKIGQ